MGNKESHYNKSDRGIRHDALPDLGNPLNIFLIA